MAEAPLLVTTGDETATQMLRPGVEERRCGWRAPWSEGGTTARDALAALAAVSEEADALENTSVETTTLHLGVVIRECATVRSNLVRRIRTVVLPSVGGGHGAHHGHH